jgi:hypothetical protein
MFEKLDPHSYLKEQMAKKLPVAELYNLVALCCQQLCVMAC